MAIDVTALDDTALADLRLTVLAEGARRQRVEQAPEQITAAITDALNVGVPAVDVRAIIDTAMEGAE